MRLELHKLTHLARFERRKRMQQKRIDRLLKEKEILNENEDKEIGEENEPEEVLLSLPPPASVSQARDYLDSRFLRLSDFKIISNLVDKFNEF